MMNSDLNFYMNLFGFLIILYFILMIIIAVAGIKISNRLKEIVEQNKNCLNSSD